MFHLYHALSALLLVATANATPWALSRVRHGRWAAPLDFGTSLADGTRMLGDHKTWRGFLAGSLACGIAAPLLGYPVWLGLAFGAFSLTADAVSSLVKRRMRLKRGTKVPGLDQLPEALVPLVALSRPLGIGFLEIGAIALVFLLLDFAATRMRHP